ARVELRVRELGHVDEIVERQPALLGPRRRPASQQTVRNLLDAVVIVTHTPEPEPYTRFAGTRLFVPAEVHRIRQVIQRLEQRAPLQRDRLLRIQVGVEVGDDRQPRGTVERFQHVGRGDFFDFGFRVTAGRLDFGLRFWRRVVRSSFWPLGPARWRHRYLYLQRRIASEAGVGDLVFSVLDGPAHARRQITPPDIDGAAPRH